jgi:hypothetical protein
MDMGKEMIETKGCKLLLDPFHFVGISRHNIITNSSAEFKFRCRAKYDTYIDSQGKSRKRLCCKLDSSNMKMKMIIHFNSYLVIC